jgi:glutathione S-transferase
MHDEVIAEFRPRAEAALSFVDKTVKDRPFLLGDACTIADIGCGGRMVFMSEGGFEIGNWPHLEAWAGRLKAMPGFALPYDLIPSKDREEKNAVFAAHALDLRPPGLFVALGNVLGSICGTPEMLEGR